MGSVITRELDAQCARVVCIDLPGRADACVREFALSRTVPVSLDVNDAATLPAALDALVATHGIPDGVAHLAFASSSGHRLESLPVTEFKKTFDLALTGTFVLCRTMARHMQPQGCGSVVHFSSM
ncbi:MAG: SDR family oxidoreductase, partial [Opitutaceae bacterium]